MQHTGLKTQSLAWMDPLEAAQRVRSGDMMLLYSGVQADFSGQYSYLATEPIETVEGEDFAALGAVLATSSPELWFGYLGYGLKDTLEHLPADTPGYIHLPRLRFTRFASVLRFDHHRQSLECYGAPPTFAKADTDSDNAPPGIETVYSNMHKAAYLQKAARVIADIHAGKLYQANLTRKFYGKFSHIPDSLALFTRLCHVSPAPYSAYLRFGETAILSSSPERFLNISDGRVTTRPIKGSAPRYADAQKDRASREALAISAKNRAENLMIVDLMRNDLARSCLPGSVRVERLFDITSHAHVHHMSSTVSADTGGTAPLEVIQKCFPPGSMTGAPKVAAMRLCTEIEEMERGVYSGALGWISADGADLSVVIRTLIVQRERFEFQVGGGIVADSTPEDEWQETLTKARGIAAALGIPLGQLEAM